jgi:hypothetical protein
VVRGTRPEGRIPLMADWLVYKCAVCGAETKVNTVHAERWDGHCWRGHSDGHTLADLTSSDRAGR